MGEVTKIQWCDHTWNPWRGCAKIAPECQNCYAAQNVGVKMNGITWGTERQGGKRVAASDAGFENPLSWNRKALAEYNLYQKIRSRVHPGIEVAETESDRKRLQSLRDRGVVTLSGTRLYAMQWSSPRVFCASLADVFEDWDGPILDHHGNRLWCYPTTSRIDGWISESSLNPEEELEDNGWQPVTMDDVRARMFDVIRRTQHLDYMLLTKRPENIGRFLPPGYWRNVWLGTSAGTNETAEKAIPYLVKARERVPVLFVSAEPLLESVSFEPWARDLDLVIFGGESQDGCRPCHIDWIREGLDSVEPYPTHVFVKQVGSRPQCWYYETDERFRESLLDDKHTVLQATPHGFTEWDHQTFGQPSPGSLIEWRPPKAGGDPVGWPEDIRIRHMPVTEPFLCTSQTSLF